MHAAGRKRLGWVLASLFALAMIMATGPGVLLVNRPVMLFGMPLIYLWAVLWYLVIAVVVLAAYCFVWRADPRDRDTPR